MNSVLCGWVLAVCAGLSVVGAVRADDAARYDIWEYQIENNTVLSDTDIEHALYSFLGADKSFTDVDAARAALEARYRDAGYPTVLVDIPEQEVNEGVVRLHVIEGRIELLSVTGAEYFSANQIRRQVPSLAEGSVPQLAAMQLDLGKLNMATADRRVTPVLRPGKVLGRMEVELKVKDKLPLHGSVGIDDRYSANTSRLRMNVGMHYDNLWQRGHSLSLQFQTAPQAPAEVQVWSASYSMDLPFEGHTLVAYGARTRSNVAVVDSLTVIGNGSVTGLRDIVRLNGVDSTMRTLSLGADYKNFEEDIHLASLSTPATTPIGYAHFSVNYQQNMQSEIGLTRFNFGPGFAIRDPSRADYACERVEAGKVVMDKNESDQFACKRADARANYFYLRGEGNQLVSLPQGFAANAALAGQWTDQPLIGNEEFSLGGVDTVRGYTESAFMGDYGVRASLELRSPSYSESLALPPKFGEARWLAFVDAGAAWLRLPLDGQDRRQGLASVGAGLRLGAQATWSASLDLAVALREVGQISAGSARLHGMVKYEF